MTTIRRLTPIWTRKLLILCGALATGIALDATTAAEESIRMQIRAEGLAGPITATLSAGEIIQNKYDQRRQLVELSLSAPIWKTLEAMREDVFTVTNGRIVEATRIDRQKMPVNGRQRWVSDRWSLTVGRWRDANDDRDDQRP